MVIPSRGERLLVTESQTLSVLERAREPPQDTARGQEGTGGLHQRAEEELVSLANLDRVFLASVLLTFGAGHFVVRQPCAL